MKSNLKLGLSPEAIASRRNYVGASDANIIMSGDAERINRLAREKAGLEAPEDLSRNLAVIMGSYTEELNRYWFELQTGQEVASAGAVVLHSEHAMLRATLDGIVTGREAVFEAKHVGPFGDLNETVQRYMPQLHHQMSTTGLRSAVLSVFVGSSRWEMFEVEYDELYGDCVVQACLEFWAGVQSGQLIKPIQAIEPPKVKGALRIVDMTGSNEWAVLAADWVQTRVAAATNADSAKALKKMVDDDVGEAAGHGVVIKRSSNGALTIREMKR